MKRQISVFRWVWTSLMLPWQEVIHNRSIIHLEDSKRPCWVNKILYLYTQWERCSKFQKWVPNMGSSTWPHTVLLYVKLPGHTFATNSVPSGLWSSPLGRLSEGCGTWCWPEWLLSTLIDSTHLRKLMHLSDAQANCQLLLPPVNMGFWFGCHGYRKL